MSPKNPDAEVAEIYSVTQLNREARQLLESGLQGRWVAGEISNLAQPGSGHLYFTLKDDAAQVRCAMFRNAQRQLGFRPADGAQVRVQGTVSIYEARGSYQIIVDRMEAAGEGLLRRQFDELKRRLAAEGLFALEHKQPLPTLPQRIGIVTSPTGAAIRDILQVLRRRFPPAAVIVYPTRVQGQGAREEIAAAIALAGQRAECDVLIVGRGGGSLEDLWCFNEELVARAIYNCPVPVISAVGHEIDTTIADMVADHRAPTPSAAAELAVPDSQALLATVRDAERRINNQFRRLLTLLSDQHQQLENRLRRTHPGAILQQRQQRIDELLRRLQQQVQRSLISLRIAFSHLHERLTHAAPLAKTRLGLGHQRLLSARLVRAMRRRLEQSQTRLALAGGSLNTVSPLATLERGYAIVRDSEGTLLSHASSVQPGARITARLAHGELEAEVVRIVRRD